jgi:hypothetical protein
MAVLPDFASSLGPRMATMHNRMRTNGIFAAWFVAVALAGCESPAWTRSLNESFGARENSTGPRTEEDHRREYVKSHSRNSMRWLLSHCVNQGMSYDQVRHILGEEGERETNDRWLKTGATNVRVDDEVYSFGPDSEGHMLYLYFREDRLINFDPSEFK